MIKQRGKIDIFLTKQRGNDNLIWKKRTKISKYSLEKRTKSVFPLLKSGQSMINRKIDNKIENFFANHDG